MTPWEKFKKDHQDKKVLIMGLGIQGGGLQAANIFSQISKSVTITDLKSEKQLKKSIDKLSGNPKLVIGKHNEGDFLSHDLIIRNPGVPLNSPFLKLAKENNVPIKMETAIFVKYFPGKIIGITGTRGKTTTSNLIFEIFKKNKSNVFLAGNLPHKSALSFLRESSADQIAVLELSSWQLQGFLEEKVSPHISVITNIYPDHLNRYDSMESYAADKAIIFKFQDKNDHLLLNKNNKYSADFAKSSKSNISWFTSNNLGSSLNLSIPGDHNLQNAAAALKVAQILSIDKDLAISAVNSFKGAPYRLETVASIDGIEMINDTTSTTPTATIKALEAVDKPTVLILGGETKELPTEEMVKTINKKSPQIVLLSGSGTEEIKSKLNKGLVKGEYKDLEKAIKHSLKLSKNGSAVLFSPGFTSFGLFDNEFHRGREFNRIVESLK